MLYKVTFKGTIQICLWIYFYNIQTRNIFHIVCLIFCISDNMSVSQHGFLPYLHHILNLRIMDWVFFDLTVFFWCRCWIWSSPTWPCESLSTSPMSSTRLWEQEGGSILTYSQSWGSHLCTILPSCGGMVSVAQQSLSCKARAVSHLKYIKMKGYVNKYVIDVGWQLNLWQSLQVPCTQPVCV